MNITNTVHLGAVTARVRPAWGTSHSHGIDTPCALAQASPEKSRVCAGPSTGFQLVIVTRVFGCVTNIFIAAVLPSSLLRCLNCQRDQTRPLFHPYMFFYKHGTYLIPGWPWLYFCQFQVKIMLIPCLAFLPKIARFWQK